MDGQQQPPQEPVKQPKRNIFALLKDPIIWMIIGIATLVCILVFLILLFIWKTLSKNDAKDETINKNPKNVKKKKPKEEPVTQQVQSDEKKEEIISTYVNKTTETKIEVSETSDDGGDGGESVKVEEIL